MKVNNYPSMYPEDDLFGEVVCAIVIIREHIFWNQPDPGLRPISSTSWRGRHIFNICWHYYIRIVMTTLQRCLLFKIK